MGSKRFRNCEKMQESCEKIARKLRETLLAKCILSCEKPNKIKGFHDFAVTETRVFQDRLVVTASIFLHIYGLVYYTIYMQSYFEVARETRFTNPLRIPHEDASSSLVGGKCGYSRFARYSCDVVNHRTSYLIVAALKNSFS